MSRTRNVSYIFTSKPPSFVSPYPLPPLQNKSGSVVVCFRYFPDEHFLALQQPPPIHENVGIGFSCL